MNRYIKEPLVCSLLLVMCILEIPFGNLFLMSAPIMLLSLTFIYRRRPVINLQAFILSVFIILYFVIDSQLQQTSSYKLFYALSVISIYLCGLYAEFDSEKIKSSNKLEKTIELIAVTYLIYVGITIIYSISKGQMAVNRNPLNIWTGQLRAATHYGTMLLIPVIYGIYLSTVYKGKKRVIGFIIVIISLLINVLTASRTIILFIPVGYLFSYFYSIKVSGAFSKRHLNQLIGSLIAVFTIMIMFINDMFGLQTMYLHSALGQRYLQGNVARMADDGRMTHWRFFFSHLSESFFGGGYSRQNTGNLHNIYLNVYDLSGIIPFILLVIFTLMLTKRIRKVIKQEKVTNEIKVLLVLLFLLSFAQVLMEPVMESVPVFCWCLLYIAGMVNSLDNTISGY